MHRCNTPNRAKKSHAIIANSQSHFKTQSQAHKSANASNMVQRRTRDFAIQKRTRDPTSSHALSGPAPACIFECLATNWSCQLACGDSKTPNTASQYCYPSATNRLVSAYILPRRYDVRTPCLHTQIRVISRHTSFQAPSTYERSHLPRCHELYDSGLTLPNRSTRMSCQRNVADQTIPRTTPRNHEIPTVVQRPTRLAHLEKPTAVSHPNPGQK